MGFFSRIKPAIALTEFQNKIFLPALNLTLDELGPDAERFERFIFVWRKVLEEAGMHAHARGGENLVKYFVFLPFEEGCKLLMWSLASSLVPGFQELPAAAKLDKTMQVFVDMEKGDGGAEFEAQFRKCNPRSAHSLEKLNQRFGLTLFSPKLHDPATWLNTPPCWDDLMK